MSNQLKSKYQLAILMIFLLTPLWSMGQQKSILFIGNSYTYYNNMPNILKQISLSTGDTLEVASHTAGGARFKTHAASAQLQDKLKSQAWDYVTVQGQSQEPSWPENQVKSDVYPFAKQLVDSINVHQPCAKPIFFMTWGRKNGDARNCPFWPPVCTYEGMDSLLQKRYNQMALDNDAWVSPVAVVWRNLRTNHPSIELYNRDESHPSLAGSYAAACTFYVALWRKDPRNIDFDAGLDTGVARIIREAAFEEVYKNQHLWGYDRRVPYAIFKEAGGTKDTVILRAQTTNVSRYYWIVEGKKQVENQDLKVHVPSWGVEVTLRSFNKNDCDSFEHMELVHYTTGSLSDFTSQSIRLKTVNGFVLVPLQGPNEVTVSDQLGRVVFQQKSEGALGVDFTNKKSGLYIFRIRQSSGEEIIVKYLYRAP